MKREEKIINLKKFTDARGSLVFAEGNADIPFEIKRFYSIYDVSENAIRGKHAHKTSDIVLFCMTGHCRVKLSARDGTSTEHTLSSPDQGLYIPAELWREMYDFTSDCVLIALSSAAYDENDYIRDFDVFMNGTKQ